MATFTSSPRGSEQSSENESDDEALPASADTGDASGKTELPGFFILEIVNNQFAPSGLSGVFFLRGPGDQARRDNAE
jgi:hypothetical protein